MQVKGFFDPRTSTISYAVWDPDSGDAVVIDPVLDYDPVGSRVWTESVDVAASFLEKNDLELHAILETHAHADHLSGAQELKRRFPGAKVVVSRRITEVQSIFKKFFDLPPEFAADGSQFDYLLRDNETLSAGSLEIMAIPTPGHTPACTTFVIEDAAFTGDALFMPDIGTGRCDFPGGSANDLYDSITKGLYQLPDDTRIFVGHDYPPEGRDAQWESTVATQKESNVQLNARTTRDEYLSFRGQRDASLQAPRLLYQSVQVNVDAGRLPQPSANEQRYLKIPVNVFRPPEGELKEEELDTGSSPAGESPRPGVQARV